MTTITDILNTAQQRAKELNLPYQGALTPEESYELMKSAPGAKLVDVRTRAEIDWVGTRSGRGGNRVGDLSGPEGESQFHGSAGTAGRQGSAGHVHLPQRPSFAYGSERRNPVRIFQLLQRSGRLRRRPQHQQPAQQTEWLAPQRVALGTKLKRFSLPDNPPQNGGFFIA